MTDRTCSIDGCEGAHAARGWCTKHYHRWQRHGTTDGPPSDIERFWSKVDFDGHCWLWTAGIAPNGYSKFSVERRHVSGHRFAYEALVGPIPEGLQLDHLCRVRHCVNPGHMEPVTSRENHHRGFSASGLNARKTHCKWGHPFDEENTYMRLSGGRLCRACGRRRKLLYAAQRAQRHSQ